VSPVKDRSGRIIGAAKIARDISIRKAAEQAIQESMAMKDQFLSLISHELRTPLSTISGSSRLLRDRFDRIAESDRNDLLDDVVAESARLQRIIENLLLMTRLEARGLELEPVLLRRIVEKSVAAFRDRNPGRELIFEGDVEELPVMGNPTYVELVLDNLLTNAAKYSPPEAPIEVLVGQDGEVGVLDRGIGFKAEDADKLFTPFFRSKEARNWASGVGVGLAVCKRVIDAQGGRIWAKPRDGGGSEFGFWLQPLKDLETM
jgi:signal transduction histidine kinase